MSRGACVPRPVLGVADRAGLDGIGNEVRERVDRRLGCQQRMLAGASLVEDFAGPAAKGFRRERKQPMELLQEPREHATHVGHDLMRMGAHEAARVHHHPEALCGEAQAVPVASLELSGLIGIEEKVAPGGAAGERPGRTRLDDASSGHARGQSDNRAAEGCRISGGIASMKRQMAAEWRSSPAAVGPQEHCGITERLLRFRQRRSDLWILGRIFLAGRDCSKLGLVGRQHSLSNERNQDALHERACCAGSFDDEDGAPTFFGVQHRSCAKCTPIL